MDKILEVSGSRGRFQDTFGATAKVPNHAMKWRLPLTSGERFFFPATRLETRWENRPSVVVHLHFYLYEETKASTKAELVGEFHS